MVAIRLPPTRESNPRAPAPVALIGRATQRLVIETVLLVPARDNDGRSFERAQWRELERRLLQFGGLTDAGNVRGVWQSGNRIYRDVNRQFTVSLRSWRQF